MKNAKSYLLLFSMALSMLAGCQKNTLEDGSNTYEAKRPIQIDQQVTNSPVTEENTTSWIELQNPIIKQLPEEKLPTEQPKSIIIESPTKEKVDVTSVDVTSNKENDEIADSTEETPITPIDYQKKLKKGMDVDWSKTSKGREAYNEQAVIDFKSNGISHVRIRIKDEANDELFQYLDKQIDDCLKNGLIPVIAYQADELKNAPTQKNIDKVVKWWRTIAKRYKNKSPLLSFDLLIEVSDALNKEPELLNEIYEQLVTDIRKTNPTRILIMSPRLRSDASYLSELKVPTDHNNYMMAEWHFYASGPSKTNERKLWTTGTKEEQDKITKKIDLALQWQKDTGIPTWVGAWMAGNYNDANDYTVEEQVVFAKFMTQALSNANIPFAVNSDTKFYDRETNQWIEEMQPVFNVIYK